MKNSHKHRRLFNTKMYSQLKFTHKNIDLAETYFESEKLEHKSSQSSLKENKMRNLKLNFASMEGKIIHLIVYTQNIKNISCQLDFKHVFIKSLLFNKILILLISFTT